MSHSKKLARRRERSRERRNHSPIASAVNEPAELARIRDSMHGPAWRRDRDAVVAGLIERGAAERQQ